MTNHDDADEQALTCLDEDRLHEECGVFGIFGHPDAAALTALGLHALAVRDDAAKLRHATHLAAFVDAGDAGAFAALGARNGIDRTVLMNFPAAAGAVVAGAWVSSRLKP